MSIKYVFLCMHMHICICIYKLQCTNLHPHMFYTYGIDLSVYMNLMFPCGAPLGNVCDKILLNNKHQV